VKSRKLSLKKIGSKFNRFVISVVVSGALILSYQIVVYLANVDLKQQQQKEIDFRTDITWKIVENIVNESIRTSKQNLNENIIPNILNDINKEYSSDNTRLELDLKKLSDLTYNDPITKIMADNIRGKYFNNIKTDSNDMFVLMKDIGVISDLSISPSANKPRTIGFEISQHYNKDLAKEAYDIMIQQNYQKQYIFWQWFEPESSSIGKVSSMKLEELKRIFKESNGDINSLQSFEFLVPEYIFVDKDILGNPLVNDRGQRQNIYQFIVVQGFNITEIVKNNSFIYNIFDNVQLKESAKQFAAISRVYQFMIFMGLIMLIYVMISTIRLKEKYDI